MKDENREILAGESRFYFGEDGIMYVEIAGKQDVEEAVAMRDAYLKLVDKVDGKVKIFVNNSEAKQPTNEARKIFSELTSHEQCGKVAVLGLNPVARVIASFVLGVSKNKNMKIFKTKEEALAWLEEE